MPSLALLVNARSGRGESERVQELLEREGATVERFDVCEPEQAAGSGAERLVVAGGDGSIGLAAAAASAAGIPVAVVATGTANDFAARLGLPTDLEEACRLAVAGEERRTLELAWAGERPFVNVASLGLAPAAAEHAHGLKGRLGVLAYPLGAIRAGLTAQPLPCRVSCDGELVHDGDAWQVSVASTGAFGGGAELAADATDGRLDLVVIEGGSRVHLAKHAYGMRVGSVEGQSGVLDSRCSRVGLRLPGGGSLNIDGEVVDATELTSEGSISFRAQGDAFQLVVG